jgi:putative PEP-CTERM system TPR-repeat lipoprotein
LAPDSERAHFMLAQAKLGVKDVSGSRKSFKKAISITPEFLPAQLGLAHLELNEKNNTAALKIAKQIKSQRPKEIFGYQLEGDIYSQSGDFAKAINAYEKALETKEHPQVVVALYQARKKAKRGNPQSVLEQWLEKNPDDQGMRSILASYYQERGDFPKAVELYEQIIKSRPKDVVALNNLAWSAFELGHKDSLKYAQRAYDLATENPAVMDTYGWLLIRGNEHKRGVDILRQAVALAPHVAEIRYHLGVGLHKLGLDTEAESEIKRTLEISNNFAGVDEAKLLLKKIQAR